MENTATKTNQQIIENICNLKHFNNQISECTKFLHIENGKTFIGISIEKICSIEETEIVFRIYNECTTLTIWKRVQQIHLSLL
jgi:hypothetical protein